MTLILNGDTGLSDVDGSAATPAIRGTDSNTGIFFPAADTIAFAEGGSEIARFDSSGNLGIGTSSPNKSSSSTALTVNTGTAANYSAVEWSSGNTLNYHINANDSAIFHVAAGTRPWIVYTNGSERMRIDSSGNLQFNSGYGSVATAYGCRAWVNFNGTGTVAIRASGNVTSITDNGVGNYLINLTTALPDSNASVTIGLGADSGSSGTGAWASRINSISTTVIQILSARPDGSYSDASIACVSVHR